MLFGAADDTPLSRTNAWFSPKIGDDRDPMAADIQKEWPTGASLVGGRWLSRPPKRLQQSYHG